MTDEVRETAEGYLSIRLRVLQKKMEGRLTLSDIEACAKDVLRQLREDIDIGTVSVDQLIAYAEMQFNTVQEEAARLDDVDVDHRPWLKSRGPQVFPEAGFWRNYRQELSTRIPDEPLRRLDEVTDEILDRFEDPRRTEQWDRRGLVIGHVQSGKTSNYVGLVAKAADAGFRLIIILAGTQNNLRAQTQQRVDAGFVGRDSSSGPNSRKKVGVGLNGKNRPVLNMTTADEDGDFTKSTASQIGNPFDSHDLPTIFVVKKHVSILKNLRDWLNENSKKDEGHDRISNFPVLVIDDEADHASVDTANHSKNPEVDPTQTNMRIRDVLNLFDQSAYVGYTATPFANVFINTKRHDEHGFDLFPRHFIFALEAPSNYVGPSKIFGQSNLDNSSDERSELPLIYTVKDVGAWLPSDHDSTFIPDRRLMPKSLKRAVCSFVLSIAARSLRGQVNVHNSMLVHVTRFVLPQNEIKDAIEEYVSELRKEVLYDPGSPVWQTLQAIWNEDFLPATLSLADEKLPPQKHEFSDLHDAIMASVKMIRVNVINGSSQDSLSYSQHDKGLSIIAVGGQSLSRGLTLEGLSVSYYLRTTSLYDTLMQMGRWYGYRDGYLDLCRIYTNKSVINWFKNISMATEELLQDLSQMQLQGGRPIDFGLKVRTSPGMMVTSQAKMRSGTKRSVTFSGERAEVTSFSIDPIKRSAACEHLVSLVQRLGPTKPQIKESGYKSSDFVWSDIESEKILEYLDRLDQSAVYPTVKNPPAYLASYIRKRNEAGGLVDWTVLLKGNGRTEAHKYLLPHNIEYGLPTRTDSGGSGRYATRSLIGSMDEAQDLTDKEFEAAERHAGSEKLSGRHYRGARSVKRGLLILYLLDGNDVKMHSAKAGLEGKSMLVPADHVPDGDPFAAFCISFPKEEHGTNIDYIVNEVYDGEASYE